MSFTAWDSPRRNLIRTLFIPTIIPPTLKDGRRRPSALRTTIRRRLRRTLHHGRRIDLRRPSCSGREMPTAERGRAALGGAPRDSSNGERTRRTDHAIQANHGVRSGPRGIRRQGIAVTHRCAWPGCPVPSHHGADATLSAGRRRRFRVGRDVLSRVRKGRCSRTHISRSRFKMQEYAEAAARSRHCHPESVGAHPASKCLLDVASRRRMGTMA